MSSGDLPPVATTRREPVLGEQANGNHPGGAVTGPFAHVVRLDIVDSTNRYCADAARSGEPEGLVVLAGSQTQGRGRRGRSWLSPRGASFLCSLLFRPPFPLSEAHVLGSIVGLAAADAMSELGVFPGLKWPNDVLIGDKKVAGVLSEIVAPSAPERARRYAVVVGIGINCSWPVGFPSAASSEEERGLLSKRATTLERALGEPIDPNQLLSSFLAGVERRYAVVRTPLGLERVMAEYRSVCTTIGELVRVDLADGSVEGRVTDIDDDGRLVLENQPTELVIEAGDVVHLRTGD